jgi:carbonic anhydrase/acetyltransferase-like protein (isoleucine patch superfamily)
MERYGSQLTDDIAYMQQLSRHRNIMRYMDTKPSLDNCWVASNSTLVGEVNVSAYSSIWYNATLRADLNPIRVGSYSSIGDHSVIYTACPVPTGIPGSVTIGKHVTIESKCTIFSSIIDDEAFIGSGTVVGEGCKIERGAVISPNSLIPHGRCIPGGQLWGGNPVKFIRNLTEEEIYSNYINTFNIWNLAQNHLIDFNLKKENDEYIIEPDSLVASYLTENYFKWRARYNH